MACLQSMLADLCNSMDPDSIPADLLMAHGTVAELCTWFIQIERAGRYLSHEQADSIWNTSLKLLIHYYVQAC